MCINTIKSACSRVTKSILCSKKKKATLKQSIEKLSQEFLGIHFSFLQNRVVETEYKALYNS